MNIKRIFTKIYIKSIFDNRNETIKDHEREISILTRRLTQLEDSMLLLTPDLSKRYVVNKQEGLTVIIQSGMVVVIKDNLAYHVPLENKRKMKKLKAFFDERALERRELMELGIIANVKNTIKDISNDIKSKLPVEPEPEYITVLKEKHNKNSDI
jgi:hypothetical protein